jgi:uncharacterized protein YqeY
MGLKECLTEDLKEALRAKDERRKTTLRLLLDAIHKAEIPSEKEAKAGKGPPRKELSEDEILQAVASEAKRRREAIAEFGKAKRADLVAKEEAELAIIMGYLPAQLSREEIEVLAREVVQELGVTDISQMGRVMGVLMSRVKGRAEGGVVSQVVREILSGGG